MATYIGLTIGPIHKTLLRARKTRELWGASYFFSFLMKQIVLDLKERFRADFIMPHVQDTTIFERGQEVGLFHDRLIARVDRKDVFDGLQKEIIIPLLKETARKMGDRMKKADPDKIFAYLKGYLNLYYCEIESSKSPGEVSREINQHLDVLELQAKFMKTDSEDYVMDFLNLVNRSFLIEDAFKKKRKAFPSIPEIAAGELLGPMDLPLPMSTANPEDTDDTAIYEKIREQKKAEFKTFHKYIAIVQADGDDLGKAIDSLDSRNTEAFDAFSRALFTFARNAHHIIRENGGTTIYAGGDDLLFFAPVVYGTGTVFDVCHNLGDCFKKEMAQALGRQEDLPTLSFGVSISYYKFPMYEALETAQKHLFSKAKAFPGKNAISFGYLKHSGSHFSGTLSRHTQIYNHFRRLITTELDQDLLTSVIHKILGMKTLVLEIGQDRRKLAHFLSNTFNEKIHSSFTPFFESIGDFIHEVCCSSEYSAQEKAVLIYSVLRLKKNLKGEEE